MRMSCNGCRVLRKGCSDDCTIRPCLQWIKSPEAQGHATVFLAKFYGRAGLLNLINAGPDHLRPAIFRSLLYEACGRVVNPIYGSVGLLWSGNWKMCQEAVENVLRGVPVAQATSDAVAEGFDVRHVARGRKRKGSSESHVSDGDGEGESEGEGSMVTCHEGGGVLGLELTLGPTMAEGNKAKIGGDKRRRVEDTCRVDLGLRFDP